MTQPKYAQATSFGRFYPIPEFGKMVSVTNVIGAKDKPALVGWAANMAAERAVKHEDVWHAIQQEEGDNAAAKFIAGASRQYSKQRMTVGSAVHWVCENHDRLYREEVQSKLDTYLYSLDGEYADNRKHVMKHYEQYKRFLDKYKPEFLLQETTVFHATEKYAGTLDALCAIKGEQYIMDIKTGKSIYDTVQLQLAAYRFATHFLCEDEPIPMPYSPHKGMVLHLKPESYKVYDVPCGLPEYETFLALKKVKEWKAGELVEL